MGNITENRIDTVLTPEALLEIRKLANQISTLLPQVGLVPAERKKKVGVKRLFYLNCAML